MLTRLRARGFKNLIDVDVEFGPYTCIAGHNAVGKSNLFDAIEFLALLADHPFLEAARMLRPSGDRQSDPKMLFTLDSKGEVAQNLVLEAEMLVGQRITDEFGQASAPRSTFVRYLIELAYVAHDTGTPGRVGGLELVREELTPISKGDAHLHLRWPHSAKYFRQTAVINNRFSGAYVSTETVDGTATLLIHADGGSRGNPRRSPISGAVRSAVSGVFSVDEPTMLAVRHEMRGWTKLALEPSSMRAPDDLYSPTQNVSTRGEHLPATLWRLAQDDEDAPAAIASDLSELTDVRRVRVVPDERRDVLVLEAQLANGPFLPAKSLSEGTLRFLALALIEADPKSSGLICMEEPENGIHPGKVGAMVDLLRRLAVDPSEAPGDENPLRQVIVNTHSPEFVRSQNPNDLLLAVRVDYRVNGRDLTGVRFVPNSDTWRAAPDSPTLTVSAVSDYLTRPEESPMWRAFEAKGSMK